MFGSTTYFLHLIDEQERVIAEYEAQQYQIERSKYYNGEPPYDLDLELRQANGGKLNTDLSYKQYQTAVQDIKNLYRNMIAIDVILLLATFIISKSLKKVEA